MNWFGDIVYYELRRFVELLVKNNPNMLELLCMPAAAVLYRHPVMDLLQSEMFLSKLCEQTFANYAFTQIKKACGLEKKIMQPMQQQRKSVPDFCFVYEGKHANPLLKFAETKQMNIEKIGLTAITNLKDCYNIFYSATNQYAGVIKNENANDVCLSSIPKGELSIAMLYFNKNGYSAYCKQYQEYWSWVQKRNEDRYSKTMQHGKKYDAKNMMHVFRLLQMAKEIAVEGRMNVLRKDRSFLLAVKDGSFGYEELLQKAWALKNELPLLYRQSGLIDAPDMQLIDATLVKMRKQYYGG